MTVCEVKGSDEVEILSLDPTRVEDLVKAQNDIFADYIIPLRSSPQFFQEFMRSVGGSTKDVIVATHDDCIVGYVNPVIDGEEAWIGGIGVLPSFRGCGVGRRLMQAAEDSVRLRGVEEITLEVIEGNSPASELYMSLGYSETKKFLSAEGRATRFAGFGERPKEASVKDVIGIHEAAYSEACWQRRKSTALTESGRTCETYLADGGFVMLRRVGTTGYVPFLGVLPERREKGVGTSLAKFALNRLWELGAFKVAIYNANDDLPTQRMLDKFDFAVTLKQIEMRKRI